MFCNNHQQLRESGLVPSMSLIPERPVWQNENEKENMTEMNSNCLPISPGSWC
jgi:hypothetical protein